MFYADSFAPRFSGDVPEEPLKVTTPASPTSDLPLWGHAPTPPPLMPPVTVAYLSVGPPQGPHFPLLQGAQNELSQSPDEN